MELLLIIFFSFLYVGTFAFGGGLATLPLLQQVIVFQHGWLTGTEWSDVFTISNMTPGPIAINAATFVGTKLAGPIGALVATLGMICTQIILCTVLAKILFGNKKSKLLTGALFGLAPGVVGLIGAISLQMFLTNLFPRELGEAASCLFTLGKAHVDIIVGITFLIGLYFLHKKADMSRILIFGALFGIGMELLF